MKHFVCFRKFFWVSYVFSIQIDKFKHTQSVIRAFYTDDSEKSITDFVENKKKMSRNV